MKKTISYLLVCVFVMACSSDSESPLNVEPPELPVLPSAAFSANATMVESGESVRFRNASENARTYEWTFEGGDPGTSTGEEPEVAYANAGNYSVTLKANNADGSATEAKAAYITVIDPGMPPVAAFSASATQVETGVAINFTDESTNMPTAWAWEFPGGDPATSTEQNPSVSYASEGTYSVTLTPTNAEGEGMETKTDYITVADIPTPPVAAFSASETTVEAGTSIDFTDETTNGPTSWTWIFEGGDPTMSTDQNPSVSYPTPGTYTVSLTATNADGEDLAAKTDYITVTVPVVAPETDFSADATTITSGQDIAFTDASTNSPAAWEWTFDGGSPGTSTEQNPTVRYNNFGTYEVELTATNSAGGDTETKTGYITVNQQTATYTVTFRTNWTAVNHPTDFPTGSDHFSQAIGMVHKPGASFFKSGELASTGIKDMAERGRNSPLSDEIQPIVTAGDALSFINVGGLATGSVEVSTTIQVTEEFSLVTLVSMIAPSPDWFVAVEDVGLFDNGNFIGSMMVGGVSYDAGTDSGPSFKSANDPTVPAVPIFEITEAPLGSGTEVDPLIAYFTFVKN